MSSFKCEICGIEIIDTVYGYVTECEHYPLEKKIKKKKKKKIKKEFANYESIINSGRI